MIGAIGYLLPKDEIDIGWPKVARQATADKIMATG
jgi:hypothetical protein